MDRKLKSIIWKLSKEDFKNIVDTSDTVSDVLRRVGLKPIGHNFRTIKRRFILDNIDVSHLSTINGTPKHKGGVRGEGR